MVKRLLLVLGLMVATGVPAFGTVTQLIGTLVDASGTPVSGTACFKLPVNAIDTSTNRALSPVPICYPVTNGTFPAFAAVVPNDVIQPLNTYYQAKITNRSGTLVFMANYVIPTGAGTFNIGLAIPTVVLTNNVSFTNVVSLNASNVFTAPQTFPQINSSNTPALSGFLRLGFTDSINARNFNGSGDLTLFQLSGSVNNNLTVGGTGFTSINFSLGGSSTLTYVVPNILEGTPDATFTVSSQSVANPGQNLNLTASGVQCGACANAGGSVNVTAGVGGSAGGTGGSVVLTPGSGATKGTVTMAAGFLHYPPAFLFAALGVPANGALVYCSDCTIANPCAGGGTGAMAKRLNGVWVCN